MYQSDRGTYLNKESYSHMFMHSCMGRLIVLAGIIAVLLLVAFFTVPSKEEMEIKITSSIKECIEANYKTKCDKIDDAVRNMTNIFATPDTVAGCKDMEDFHRYNSIEIYRHPLYSTARIHNNLNMEGIRVGIGVFGITIPTITFSDMILRVGPVRKDYNQKIIRNSYGDEDLGNNPDFGDTYNTYEGGGSGR